MAVKKLLSTYILKLSTEKPPLFGGSGQPMVMRDVVS